MTINFNNTIEHAERITPEVMLKKHISETTASVLSYPCTAIVYGIEDCEQTKSIECLLATAVKPKDGKNVTELIQRSPSSQCFYCYKVVILGAHPFNNLTWLM